MDVITRFVFEEQLLGINAVASMQEHNQLQKQPTDQPTMMRVNCIAGTGCWQQTLEPSLDALLSGTAVGQQLQTLQRLQHYQYCKHNKAPDVTDMCVSATDNSVVCNTTT